MPRYKKLPVVIEAHQFWNDRPFPEGVCDCAADPMVPRSSSETGTET